MALMDAAARGRLAGVSVALLAGGEVDGTDPRHGRTALMATAMRGHSAVVEALVAAGARVNGSDNHGWTPLMYAVHNGHATAAAALLGAGADVHAASEEGVTALHLAASCGRLDIVQALLQAGADPAVRDGMQKAPVDVVRRQLPRRRGLGGVAVVGGGGRGRRECIGGSMGCVGEAPVHPAPTHSTAPIPNGWW
jgi:hypothetical protein